MCNGLDSGKDGLSSPSIFAKYPWMVLILICLIGLGFSFLQAGLFSHPDTRVTALKAVFDQRYHDYSDPWPSVRAARQLAIDNRTPIYDANRVAGSAYIYPPIAALFYRPFAGLEKRQAFLSLSAVNRALFAATYLLLLVFLWHKFRLSWKTVAGLLVVAVCYYPLLRAVQLNQSTLLMTAMLGITWVSLQRKRNIVAGAALAIANAIKPQLILILPFLIWSSPATIFWALGCGCVILGASVIYAGIDNHLYYVTKVLPTLSAGYSFYANQSFNGLLNRLLLPVPIREFALAPKTTIVQILTLVSGIITYGIALWIAWRQRYRQNAALPVFGFAWLVTTLISPISWEHHYGPALFVFAWICRQYMHPANRLSVRFMIPTAISFVLIAGYFDIFSLHGALPGLLISYLFYGGVMLAVTLAVMLEKHRAFA